MDDTKERYTRYANFPHVSRETLILLTSTTQKENVMGKERIEIELEGVFHLKALLQDPEVREEIQSILKEWVEDGNITVNVDIS